MDELEKFLRKQSKGKRLLVLQLIDRILAGELDGCDIKKLKGHKDLYRLRSGKIRIVFRKTSSDMIILKVSYRDDRTYDL